MNPYLAQTKAAAIDLFAALNREQIRLNSHLQSQKKLREYAKELFEYGNTHGWTGEIMIDWAGAEQSADEFQKLAAEARILMDNLKSAHAAIAGAVLQIAKQGISFVHGPLRSCPPGRAVGSQTLSAVIWHGRNQAMHYEEGTNKPATTACFATLEADFGQDFCLARTNLAAHVLRIIGWHDYANYEADMANLLP
jgi:hypothetical protein